MKEIFFSKDAVIKNIKLFKNEILAALDEDNEVVLNLSNQRRLDLSSVQVICAARIEAKQKSKVFKVSGMNKEIVRQFEICGYAKNGGGK
ncbi:MAG: STAS domain-containing protein [Spirochaetes bacterium]|nr:STAS domain-containing protein [Spirochaetota bacterium]